MQGDAIIHSIFLIFTGAALLATLALYARQSLLVSYILLGGLFGPWGLALVNDTAFIHEISHIGIMFLLFLLGLNLHPQQLVKFLGRGLIITLLSSLVFALTGFGVAMLFSFSFIDSLLIGASCMFSSTIIALKLLPTSQLHHQHIGGVIISILLLQDLIAIALLLVIQAQGEHGSVLEGLLGLLVAVPVLLSTAFLGARYLLVPLFHRFAMIQEYIFLAALGWCLGIAQLGAWMGISYEVGAFTAGIAMATGPIARFIAESLKPLRDFFLILFFFSLGASFDMGLLPSVVWPALLLLTLIIFIKPLTFRRLMVRVGEVNLAQEVGVRMAQMSEFSLFISIVAVQSGLISTRAGVLIQLLTLLSFVVSSYVVMLRYPSPIAVNDELRRD